MNKKGQFFLVFAIVIIFFLFLVTATYNSAWSLVEIENFEELSDNFGYEQDVVINKAIYEGADVANNLEEFGTTFAAYSGTVDPNFGFYQVYQDPNTGKIHINNFLPDGRTITLEATDSTFTGAEQFNLVVASSTTETDGTISLDVGGQVMEDTVSTELINYEGDYNTLEIDAVENLILSIEGVSGQVVLSGGEAGMLDVGGTTTFSTDDFGTINVEVLT